jgi:uncharacterized protein YqeY
MSIFDQVSKDIGTAMKARDQARLAPLRMLKTALTNRQVERGRALDATEERQVVTNLIKQRRDSIELFRQGGRHDLADRETAEIGVLEGYLPAAADPAEIARIIDAVIAEVAATSPKDHGRVMKALMPKLQAYTVDGREINETVRRKLSVSAQS